jgi:hypothetical protein
MALQGPSSRSSPIALVFDRARQATPELSPYRCRTHLSTKVGRAEVRVVRRGLAEQILVESAHTVSGWLEDPASKRFLGKAAGARDDLRHRCRRGDAVDDL